MGQLVDALVTTAALTGNNPPDLFFGQQVTFVIGVLTTQRPRSGAVPPGASLHPTSFDILDHPQAIPPQKLCWSLQAGHQAAFDLNGFVIRAHIVLPLAKPIDVISARPELAASIRMGVEIHPYRGKPKARAANTAPNPNKVDDQALPKTCYIERLFEQTKGTPCY